VVFLVFECSFPIEEFSVDVLVALLRIAVTRIMEGGWGFIDSRVPIALFSHINSILGKTGHIVPFSLLGFLVVGDAML